MEKRLFLVIVMLGLMVLGGCGGTTGRIVSKESQAPYFRPKRVWGVEMNQAWDLTLKALDWEGISLEAVNQEMGLIQTDYKNLTDLERNKCDIRLSPEPERKTNISIRCRYERRKDAAKPFEDFTDSSPGEAMKAAEDLYRRLEDYILPFEKASMPQEAAVERAPAPPAPVAEKAVPKVEAAAPPVAAAAPKAEAAAPPGPIPLEKPEKREETLFIPMMTASATNVHLATSTQSKIIAVLPKGERVEKIGESGNWSKVKLPSGVDAWVLTNFLQPASAAPLPAPAAPTAKPLPVKTEAPPPPPVAKAGKPAEKGVEGPTKVFFVTKGIAQMRAEPNLKSKVVLVLKKGRKVEKLEESGEFVKVRLSWGDSGWVHKHLLEPAP